RWSAQHEIALTEAEEIGQVGLAAAELFDRQRLIGPLEPLTQIRFEPARIETLVRALLDQFRRFKRRIYPLHDQLASFATRPISAWHDARSLSLATNNYLIPYGEFSQVGSRGPRLRSHLPRQTASVVVRARSWRVPVPRSGGEPRAGRRGFGWRCRSR